MYYCGVHSQRQAGIKYLNNHFNLIVLRWYGYAMKKGILYLCLHSDNLPPFSFSDHKTCAKFYRSQTFFLKQSPINSSRLPTFSHPMYPVCRIVMHYFARWKDDL